MRRVLGNIARLRDIAAIMLKHGLGHYWQLWQNGHFNRSVEPVLTNDVMAERFSNMLQELGPTFIKFGQLLSTRPDLLPPEFVKHLSRLQDSCVPMAEAVAQKALQAGLSRPVAVCFAEIDWQPLASGSMAQVHRARTMSGQWVAVKIQRAHIRQTIEQDMELLQHLAGVLELMLTHAEQLNPRQLVHEFEQALIYELDFHHEAKVMALFQKHAKARAHLYVVPETFPELSSQTVLTMTLLEGQSLSHCQDVEQRQKIAEKVVRTAFLQVFVDGLFHADPHPGNCLILSENRLGLLDFGCTGRITFAMRETLVIFTVALVLKDADTVARMLYRMSTAETHVSLQQLRNDIAALLHSSLDNPSTFAAQPITALMSAVFQLATRHHIALPAEYALLLRSGMILEGLLRHLDPTFRVTYGLMPMLRGLIEEQLGWQQLPSVALKNILRARDWAKEVPLVLSQILLDLEGGKLQVRLHDSSLKQWNKSIVHATQWLIWAIALLAATIASSVSSSHNWGQRCLQWVAGLVLIGIPFLHLLRYGQGKK